MLGKVGTIEKSDKIIEEAVIKIKNGEVEPSQITKTVMVIDEAQDMDANEFELIKCLMEYNEDMRVIAVGDDDQNIYEFRGSSSEYMKRLIKEKMRPSMSWLRTSEAGQTLSVLQISLR